MIVPYYPEDSNEDYYSYYLNQAGHGFNVFKGSTVQTGHGIGSFLGGLARSAMPIMKSFAGKALKTGMSFAKDAMSGKDLGQSALKHAKIAGSGLLDSLSEQLGDAGDASDDSYEEPPQKRRRSNKSSGHSKRKGILSKVRIQG